MSHSPDMPETDALDLLLQRAMTARPEEQAGIDLAAAALTRARARDAQAAAMARLGRWIGVSVVAAALLTIVSVTYVIRCMPANGTTSQTQTTVQTTDSSSTSSNESEMAALALLGAAAVGLALAGVMGADRRLPRLVPSA